MATENQTPVHKIKVGSVQASIWLQTPEEGTPFYTVTFSRSYKKDEEWKNGYSYSAENLDFLTDASIDAKDWMRANRPSKQKAA